MIYIYNTSNFYISELQAVILETSMGNPVSVSDTVKTLITWVINGAFFGIMRDHKVAWSCRITA